jgi:hypothetical protein
MSGAAFREAMRRWLGLHRPDPGGLCPKCDTEQTGEHALRCIRTGEGTFRHNTVRDLLARWLTGVARLTGVQKEVNEPFIALGREELRIDILVPGGQLTMPDPADSGKDILLDVTLSDPTGPRYRAAAANRSGVAAASAVMAKNNHYLGHLDLDRHKLITIAFELYGYSADETRALIRTVALHQYRSNAAGYTLAQHVARWRQRLSVALQRVASDSLARNFARTRARGGGAAPPAVDAYLQVALLRPTVTLQQQPQVVEGQGIG